MPRKDGTGPMGRAGMNGRGLGFCNGTNPNRKSNGRNIATDQTVAKIQKELLQVQKELLESKLDIISKQLELL